MEPVVTEHTALLPFSSAHSLGEGREVLALMQGGQQERALKAGEERRAACG